MSERKPQPSLQDLVESHDRLSRGLDLMNQTVEQRGKNLFPLPYAQAMSEEGIGRSTQLVDVGLKRELVCGVYETVKIPKAQQRLEQIKGGIRQTAAEISSNLRTLLDGEFITLEDYSAGVAPLKIYTEEEVVPVGPELDEGEEYLALRQVFEDRIKGLKFRGVPRKVLDELLKSLTPETSYHTRALRDAVFADINPQHRDSASLHIAYLRNKLVTAGVTIATQLASSNTKYYLSLLGNETIDVRAPKASASEPIVPPKDDGPFVKRIDSQLFTPVQLRGVDLLRECTSSDTAISRDDLLSLMYPGVNMKQAEGRFNMILPRIRDGLESVHIYVHTIKTPDGAKYFLSEVPKKRRRDRKNISFASANTRRRGPQPSQQDSVVLSDKEVARREIEDRVKEVTMGGLKAGNLIDDDE